jgi:hypothetical protein
MDVDFECKTAALSTGSPGSWSDFPGAQACATTIHASPVERLSAAMHSEMERVESPERCETN